MKHAAPPPSDAQPVGPDGRIAPTSIVEEMERSYLDYAMSVIIARALPDVRDGMKPVHRRILYSMWESGLRPGARFRKSAAVVGDVLKSYHPHGDSAVYDAMVRLAQPWNMREMLVQGQGNFGCFTGDTRIKLLDGTEPTFEALTQRFKEDERFFVYSCNGRGEVVVGEARNPRRTKRHAQIVNLTFDDGTTVRCTPDHRFLLRNGTYKQAQELTVEDSLMAATFDMQPVKEGLNPYIRVKHPRSRRWEFVHHLADRFNAERGAAKVFHAQKITAQWNDPLFQAAHRRGARARHQQWIEENPSYYHDLAAKSAVTLRRRWRDPAYKERVVKSKILGYVAGLIAREGGVTPERYESARIANGVPRLERALAQFSNFDAMVQEAREHNHRVIAIRRVRQREDVYDITVEEHHNFLLANGVVVHNSMDGDAAAAYRYTEAKLAPISEDLLRDIEKDTVNFIPNFDGTTKEPTVLPALLPNLLINGTVGIAVGMATSIPPHNLGEVCDAVTHLAAHPKATVEDLLQFVKGPDFPTGATIFDQREIMQAYATGKGSVVCRADAEITEDAKGTRIIVTSLPYAVNKATLIEKIAELVQDKKIEGIRDLRDESSRGDVRVVIDLKKDAYPKKVLNRLYHSTQLQDTFHMNMLAIVDGLQPRVLNLKSMLEEYLKHRREVVRRRTAFDLARAKERAHILEGLKLAILKIDAVIETIKKSKDRDEARVNLIAKFKLSEPQANAILDMRLAQLANLERIKVEQELKEKQALIAELEAILKSEQRMLGVITKEVADLKARYATPRRTQVKVQGLKDFRAEDLIPNVPAIVMLTRDGYLKRVPPDTFKTQGRGGKGVIGLTTKEEDVVEHLFATMTHADVLFFTTRGRVFQLKAYDIPEASRTAKGQAVVNFLNLSPAEKVSAILPISDFGKEEKFLVMVTRHGVIKKVELAAFANVRKSGLIALKLRGDDLLEYVKPSTGHDEILLVSRQGQAIRFKEKDVRPMGRAAAGVRGLKLAKANDIVVGMDVIGRGCHPDTCEVLVVMDKGFGKRTALSAYRMQGRGGSGIKTAEVTPKTGRVTTAFVVNSKAPPQDLIVVSTKGQVIRLPYAEIRVTGRATQGVRVMRFKEEGDEVASVTYV